MRAPAPGALEAELLFLTEILGAEVIDVRQRRLGTVRDLTVRVQEPYPVVTGLVTSRRRQQVIPWSMVRSFAAATREVALRASREEVERYQADPGDVWLARDVLDKQVVDTDGPLRGLLGEVGRTAGDPDLGEHRVRDPGDHRLPVAGTGGGLDRLALPRPPVELEEVRIHS